MRSLKAPFAGSVQRILFVGVLGAFVGQGQMAHAERERNWFQAMLYRWFVPYDSSALDAATFLPEPLAFLALQEAWFGVDCAFAVYQRPDGMLVPDDLPDNLAGRAVAQTAWENGNPFREVGYTAFQATPVSGAIAMGMSKETGTFALGPDCDPGAQEALAAQWFEAAGNPGWYYAFGWGGDFMVLVDSGFSRAMVAFRD